MFWLIYYLDRELVYPTILDTIVSTWQNHVMHTLPVIGVVIEYIINIHTYPKYFWNGAKYTVLFTVIYIVWYISIFIFF